MPDVCDKHDKVMDRLFNNINEIKISNAKIEGHIEEIKSFKDKLHETIYGNGKEGLLSKVAGLLRQLNLQWTLLVLILGGLIGFILKK